MKYLTGGMNTGVGPTTAHDGDGLAQDGLQGFFHFFLYGNGIFLYLPAMIVFTVVRSFKKISQGGFLIHFNNFDNICENYNNLK